MILASKIPTKVALQPIVELNSLRTFGYEALARWSGFAPDQIYALAEQTHCILGLEKQIADYIYHTYCHVPGKLFINVHPSIPDPSLWVPLHERYGYNLILEITEGSRLNWDGIDQLRQQGFHLALDDFGSGYANINTLFQMKPDYIKLDKYLVQSLNETDRTPLIHALVEQAHCNGAKVIAEGIETEDQFQAVQKAGCDYGQGYLLGHPEFLNFSTAR
ncbi:EAL domain-containing protein [Desulfitobacterium sp. AusDCA]|uniref:EAL domain-containing protein n=1 Tax=Desulfitobacterium sp. AusDCA TaxID=3240383 RepID=UPI003DA71FF7